MKFRKAIPEDHALTRGQTLVVDAFVSDSKTGPRYWVVVFAYTFGQSRIQVWWERQRGMTYPDILHEHPPRTLNVQGTQGP